VVLVRVLILVLVVVIVVVIAVQVQLLGVASRAEVDRCRASPVPPPWIAGSGLIVAELTGGGRRGSTLGKAPGSPAFAFRRVPCCLDTQERPAAAPGPCWCWWSS